MGSSLPPVDPTAFAQLQARYNKLEKYVQLKIQGNDPSTNWGLIPLIVQGSGNPFTLTTTGDSGPSTLTGSTPPNLNIPIYASGGSSATVNAFIHEAPIGVINGTNKTFELSFSPLYGWLILALTVPAGVTGSVQDPTITYTLSGSTITYTTAPPSGSTHHAWYVQGAPALIPPTTPGDARHFNGSGNQDRIIWSPVSDFYTLTGDMSFGCWVNVDPTTTNTNTCIIRLGDQLGGLSLVALFWFKHSFNGTTWDLEYLQNDTSGLTTNIFSCGMAANTWYYVGFSRAAGVVTCYVGNGASIVSKGTFTTAHPPTGTPFNLYVGNSGLGTGLGIQGLGGILQEHYIWNRAISITEHVAAMNDIPPTSGIQLYCLMGAGTPTDLSPNACTAAVNLTTVVPGH